MITIEEKLKLFTKLVYDRVERENENAIKDFNEQYGRLLEKKKQEFQNEAQEILKHNVKEAERERIKILSKARVEEKKIILEKRKEIFETAVKKILDYAKAFTSTNDYKKLFLTDMFSVSRQLEGENIDIYIAEMDRKGFEEEIKKIMEGKKINFIFEDEIMGGFIVVDRDKNIRIDLSILTKIKSSSELIGNKLFKILQ